MEKIINEIVDGIYKDFSQSVGVANIREYEEKQLKEAQEVAEERLNLSNQLAKLKYQYVVSYALFFWLHITSQNLSISYVHFSAPTLKSTFHLFFLGSG